MKKPFYDMLEQKFGKYPVSYPVLREFLATEGFGREDVKTIMMRYFTASINHYTLKKFPTDE